LAIYLPLILAWLVFGVLHSVLAVAAVKARLQKMMGSASRYYRLIYSVFAFAILAWVLHQHFSIDEIILWLPGVVEKILAWLLVLGGLTIMVICIKKYFLYLSGIDALMDIEYKPVLEQTGLHAYVRHPLYFGTLVFVWGIFWGYPYMHNLVSVVCITIYTLIGAFFEEKKLVKEYGEAYRQYQQRVPMIIPKLG
jgi:protein-S-isoprenylcysteine O-methyltransferase Ste14